MVGLFQMRGRRNLWEESFRSTNLIFYWNISGFLFEVLIFVTERVFHMIRHNLGTIETKHWPIPCKHENASKGRQEYRHQILCQFPTLLQSSVGIQWREGVEIFRLACLSYVKKICTLNKHDTIIPIKLVHDKGRADQQELIHGLLLLYEQWECMSGNDMFQCRNFSACKQKMRSGGKTTG